MAVKRVFSAGGIVLRRFTLGDELLPDTVSSKTLNPETVSGKGIGGWRVLVTQHSKHKGWDFPKGHREIYESEEQTALREVAEETGVKAEIIEKVGSTQYFYHEDNPDSAKASTGKERVLKRVTFFLMKYVGEGEATTAFEVSGTKWLPIDEVDGQLTFKDTKELWKKAKEKVEKLAVDG